MNKSFLKQKRQTEPCEAFQWALTSHIQKLMEQWWAEWKKNVLFQLKNYFVFGTYHLSHRQSPHAFSICIDVLGTNVSIFDCAEVVLIFKTLVCCQFSSAVLWVFS